jgi:hypothetical protein
MILASINTPYVPNFVGTVSSACIHKYHEVVETFLRSIGVTEQNANQFEMRTWQNDGLDAEIWRGTEHVGNIIARWEVRDGYRFVVECRVVPTRRSKGDTA